MRLNRMLRVCSQLAACSFWRIHSSGLLEKHLKSPDFDRDEVTMKIHEYQGKELLKRFGVAVPRGLVARSPEEAYHAAKELGTDVVVVKAQIHAGGRGKGGGVKLAKSADEARESARKMLGMKLVTHQTGPEGREVRVLLVEEGLPIDKEFYLGIVLDRASGRPVFMASAAGGMDIEEVAAKTPEQIFKETINPAVGFR